MIGTTAGSARAINPMAVKLAWLVALGLATLIPNAMITGLINERQDNDQAAKQAIAHTWGPAQTIGAPALILPFKTPGVNAAQPTTTYVRIKPETLDMDTEIVPEQRRRGFFEATVYTATVHVKGTFTIPESIPAADGTPLLPPRSGFVAVWLNDSSGVMTEDKATIDGVARSWEAHPTPDAGPCKTSNDVLVVPASLTRAQNSASFEATLHARGTGQFRVGGLSRAANVTIKGAWPSPSFIGDVSPASSNVTAGGFEGRWHMDGVDASGFSTSACVVDASDAASSIGVDLIDAMPIYRMVMRATKYAPLFVVLAFTAYFAFELATGVAITILQYALMAASLSLFALLLVSVGEFTGYTIAYVLSALLVTAQASIFTASVARRLRPGLGFAGLLAGLFGFVYVLLGLETFALLTGAVALFLVLCLVMVVTQRVYRREAVVAG